MAESRLPRDIQLSEGAKNVSLPSMIPGYILRDGESNQGRLLSPPSSKGTKRAKVTNAPF